MRAFLLLLTLCLLPLVAQGQVNDSLIVLWFQSEPGVRPGFDVADYGAGRLDADGDGISDLLEVKFNENGIAESILVRSIALDSLYYEVDLIALRIDMQNKGFTNDDIAALRFERFLPWYPEGSGSPIGAMLFSANDGIVIHDPLDNFNIGMPPTLWRFFAVASFIPEDFPVLIMGNKQLKTVEVYRSRFASSN